MKFDAKISPVIAFAIIIAVTFSAVILMESFFTAVDREMDAMMEVV